MSIQKDVGDAVAEAAALGWRFGERLQQQRRDERWESYAEGLEQKVNGLELALAAARAQIYRYKELAEDFADRITEKNRVLIEQAAMIADKNRQLTSVVARSNAYEEQATRLAAREKELVDDYNALRQRFLQGEGEREEQRKAIAHHLAELKCAITANEVLERNVRKGAVRHKHALRIARLGVDLAEILHDRAHPDQSTLQFDEAEATAIKELCSELKFQLKSHLAISKMFPMAK